jgi:diadenosine tetraphosphate (Ap4A) HIT family hydrolase
MTCAMCKLATGAHGFGVPEPVYEDDVATVLVDSAPGRRGQALIIPKHHIRTLLELDERTGMHLFKLGMRAALSLGSEDEALQVSLESAPNAHDSHVHLRIAPFKSEGGAA